MKISHLTIPNFNQFRNFYLDLTYPKGHPKAGQPLDKVCFIGQSGTGKTTLLRNIKDFVAAGLNSPINLPEALHWSQMVGQDKTVKVLNKGHRGLSIKKSQNNSDSYQEKEIIKYLKNYYENSCAYIYFEAELNLNFEEIFTKPATNELIFQEGSTAHPTAKKSKLEFTFNTLDVKSVWTEILKEINEYKQSQLKFSSQLLHSMQTKGIEPISVQNKIAEWAIQNPNPIAKMAQPINSLLQNFFIKIKSDFEFEQANDLEFIQIQHLKKNDEPIPLETWSTGAKQLVMTSIPLIQLKTDRAIILLDEPERSFYPDIQRLLPDYYQSLAPDAQFFFATHSPIVASAFEPWEIVELKFNDKGFVYQEKYYEGDEENRHVDNYTIDPRYLEWQDVLRYVFDVPMVNSEVRRKALNRFSELGNKLRNGISDDERATLQLEYERLGEKLKWKKA